MKKMVNEDYYNKIVFYLERNFNNLTFEDNLRDNYLKEALTKYIRTVKSIQLLDLNGLHQECDVLIRSLDELIIDIAYLELDADNNYERHYLYTFFEQYNLLKEKCDEDNINISDIDKNDEIKQKHDEYERRYRGKLSRWSGKSYYDEAQEIDNNTTNNIIPFTMLFKRIYRINCLFSHNSGIILEHVYKFLDVAIEPDYMYFNNLNYVVILTALLILEILPDLFQEDAPFLKEFDSFIGGLLLIKVLSQN